MTYKELGMMVLDLTKLYSDDADITIEHVIGLAKPYRAFLLDQKYNQSNTWKKPNDSNFQSIMVHLVNISNMNPCGKPYMLKSVEKIPDKLNVGTMSLFTRNLADYNISFVNMAKLKLAGSNKYARNQIYAAMSGGYLFLSSGNPTIQYLEKIGLTGVFEDVEAASELSVEIDGCMSENPSESNCDPYDNEFPLEEELMPQLIDYILKQTIGAAYRPEDPQNNANDDLSNIHSFVRQHMKNEFDRTLNGQ